MPARFLQKAQCLTALVLAALAIMVLAGSAGVAAGEGRPPVAVIGSFIDPSFSDEALFAADGKTVAFPEIGLLWDATTGLPLRRLIDPVYVTAGAFTPDGAVFVSGHKDGAIKLWNVATGEIIATLAKPNDDVHRIESLWVDAKGELLVSGDHTGTVTVWRLATRRSERTIDVRGNLKGGSDPSIVAAKRSADGSRLIVLVQASFPRPGTTFFDRHDAVVEYDARSGAERAAVVLPAKHAFIERGLVGDGDALVIVTTDCERGELKQWSFAAGAVVADILKPATCDLPKDGSDVDPAKIFSSPQSFRVLIAPGDAAELMLWDVAGRKLEKTIRWPGLAAAPKVIGVAQDLTAVAVAERGAVRLRALDSGAPLKELRSFGPGARYVIARGGQILLQRDTGDGDSPTIDLDLRSDRLEPVALHIPQAGDFTLYDFAPAAKLALVASEKGELLVVSLEAGQAVRRLSVEGLRSVSQALLSPDGRTALLAGEFGKDDDSRRGGVLVDTADGRIRHTFEPGDDEGDITAYAFTADGATFAVGRRNGTGELWNARALKRIRMLRPAVEDTDVRALSFSPDGKFLLGSGAFDGSVYAWNVTTGKALRSFDLGRGGAGYTYASAVAMSRDGKTVAAGLAQRHISSGDTGRESGNVVVFDAATGKRRFTLRGQRGAIFALAFSADDRFIVSGSLDGTIQYWDRGTGRLMATAMSSASNDWLVLSESGYYAGSDNADAALAVVRGRESVPVAHVRAPLRNAPMIDDLLKGDGSRYRDAARKLDLPAAFQSASP